MTNDQDAMDNVTWFHHAIARENFFSNLKQDQLTMDMAASWKRQKMIAWGRMSQAERNAEHARIAAKREG
jgi:hypothetical protein